MNKYGTEIELKNMPYDQNMNSVSSIIYRYIPEVYFH